MRGWVIIVQHKSHKATRHTYPMSEVPEVGKRPACTVSSVQWGIALYEARPECDYPTKSNSIIIIINNNSNSFFVNCQTLYINLTYMWLCIVLNFLTIKPTRCIHFSNLFWNETLHVSDNTSVRHQEFFTVHTAMVCVIQVCWQLASRIRTEPVPSVSCSQAVCTVKNW